MKQEPVQTIEIDADHRLQIVYDEDPMNPRTDRDPIGKLCIREQSRYNLPNELDFTFEEDKEEHEKNIDQLRKDYIVFGVRFRDYGSGAQSFHRVNEDFDGFIAFPISYELQEADRQAKDELKTYNQYLVGEVYGGIVEEKQTRINQNDGRTMETWGHIDSCWGFYSYSEVIERAKEEGYTPSDGKASAGDL